MKIIGHTAYGYLAEIAPHEVAAITGKHEDDRHTSTQGYGRFGSHPIGTELKVSETWGHLERLLRNEQDRKRIAESLRAAATLIEHTPSPVILPPEPPPAS